MISDHCCCDHQVICQFDHGQRLILTAFGPDILRVQVDPPPQARPSLCVQAQPSGTLALAAQGEGMTVTNGSLTALIGPDGHIVFSRHGLELLRETGRGWPTNALPNPEDRRGAEQTWQLPAGDALFGLGQYQDGVINRRGSDCTLIHGNVTVAVPFLVSTGSWGLLWDNASHTTFHDGPDGLRLCSEVADGIDYYLCVGDDPPAAIAGYRRLTGAAPLFPRGFYGFIQCKERYQNAEELVAVTREHRQRGIPLDVIVQDWRYWGPSSRWSGMVYDPQDYGDLPQAVRQIHDLHASVMISIWPVVGPDCALHAALQEAGHLFETVHWSGGHIYDAFSPEARAIYWQHAHDGLFAHGIDAWWMDGTEPEFADCHDQMVHKAALLAQRDTAAGSWARVLNAFSLVTTQGVYQGQRAASDDKRVFILTRSAFTGQQAYAAATWSGDISASWQTLARQIPAGLNFCASGLPYWTTDNGAFFVRGRGGTFPEGVADPAFREFFLRWTQYSAFCPLMRSHGTQTPREAWHFGSPGDPIYDGIRSFIGLRMRLLPYSYNLAYQAWAEGGTPMQPLAFRFPGDATSAAIADQFFYGPALMVCPVTRPMLHAPSDRIDMLLASNLHSDGGDGLRRVIHDALDDEAPVEDRRIMNDFDYSWNGNPPPGVSSESYRVSWRGDLRLDPACPRTLVLRVAGRVRMQLDGRTVVDDWQDGPIREWTIDLPPVSEPRLLPLALDFGHVSGDASVTLGWGLTDLPQLDPQAPQQRPVYLPPGDWFDFWTGQRLGGGVVRDLDAPLERIPVLVPAGSILPLGSERQWHDEQPDTDLEIRIYRGADACCTLYEDAGNGYAYERGHYSTITLHWHEADQTLAIAARQGGFPGMLAQRTFHVVLVDQDHGTGIAMSTTIDRSIHYDGTALRVRMEG